MNDIWLKKITLLSRAL